MSELGVPPAPQQLPQGAKPADLPLWILLTAIAVMLALAAAAAFFLTYEGAAAKPVRTYPKQWDSRVAPYVKKTERLRGLAFLHPVEVRFLPPAEFEKDLTADEKDLSKEDRAELEQFTGLMRAFGLIKGEVDLFSAGHDIRGGGTLAYYSFEDERITIRGMRVTPAVRATLVHELTHVLQDQQFKIGDQVKKLHKQSKDAESSSAASVLNAIIEGDASRVETLYRDSLNPKQRKALEAASKDESAEAGKRLEDVPEVLLTLVAAPYTLGEALTQVVAADGGNDAVDKLFRDAPTDETALLNPLQVLPGHAVNATKVDAPKLEKGEKKFDSGEFGVLGLYLMLAERLPLRDALAAVDGWGADAYVAFERDGTSCARMAIAGRTRQHTAGMGAALQSWISKAPGSPAKVIATSGSVTFESCDPGKAANVGRDASRSAVALVATRAYLGVGLLRGGATEKRAHCMSIRMAQEFPVSRLNDRKFAGAGSAELARVRQIATTCPQ